MVINCDVSTINFQILDQLLLGVVFPGVAAPGVAWLGVASQIRCVPGVAPGVSDPGRCGVTPGVSEPFARPGVSSQRLAEGVACYK